MEKLKLQVNVTFLFWLMYPPRNGKIEISGQCDIFVLADVPPPPRNEKVEASLFLDYVQLLMIGRAGHKVVPGIGVLIL